VRRKELLVQWMVVPDDFIGCFRQGTGHLGPLYCKQRRGSEQRVDWRKCGNADLERLEHLLQHGEQHWQCDEYKRRDINLGGLKYGNGHFEWLDCVQ